MTNNQLARALDTLFCHLIDFATDGRSRYRFITSLTRESYQMTYRIACSGQRKLSKGIPLTNDEEEAIDFVIGAFG